MQVCSYAYETMQWQIFTGVLRDGLNLFQEIRKFRVKQNVVSSRIDNEVGSKNISFHFAKTYYALYNKVKIALNLIQLEKDDLSWVISKKDYKLLESFLQKLKQNFTIWLLFRKPKKSHFLLKKLDKIVHCAWFNSFAYTATYIVVHVYRWTANAVINYYNRKRPQVYSAAMDMSKAFDGLDSS